MKSKREPRSIRVSQPTPLSLLDRFLRRMVVDKFHPPVVALDGARQAFLPVTKTPVTMAIFVMVRFTRWRSACKPSRWDRDDLLHPVSISSPPGIFASCARSSLPTLARAHAVPVLPDPVETRCRRVPRLSIDLSPHQHPVRCSPAVATNGRGHHRITWRGR